MKHTFSSRFDLAHSFFYKDHNELCRAGRVSYEGNRFFSYRTCIGLIFTDKKGNRTLLVSRESMSVSTGRHRNALLSACPFKYIYVPFQYGQRYPTVESLTTEFNTLIDTELKQNHIYTRKDLREYATELLQDAKVFKETTGQKIPLLNKYKKYLEKKLNTENIKAEKAKEKARAKKQKELLAKKVAQYKKEIANIPLLDTIKDLFFTEHSREEYGNYAYKAGLFKQMFDVKDPSFVIVNGDSINTTQRICMPLEQVLPLLKAWKHKHNIVGQKLGWYTVLANNDKMVKVGCHNIPVENVQALADTLLNEQK